MYVCGFFVQFIYKKIYIPLMFFFFFFFWCVFKYLFIHLGFVRLDVTAVTQYLRHMTSRKGGEYGGKGEGGKGRMFSDCKKE